MGDIYRVSKKVEQLEAIVSALKGTTEVSSMMTNIDNNDILMKRLLSLENKVDTNNTVVEARLLDLSSLSTIGLHYEGIKMRLELIETNISTLVNRISDVEKKIESAYTDVATPLEVRLSALETKPDPVIPAPVDLDPILTRLDALEFKMEPVDLAPLDARVAALEAKPEAVVVDLAPLDARITALEEKE